MDWENLNFVPEEFACRCGCDAMEINDDFVLVLQEIRSSYSKSMHVTSVYRLYLYTFDAAYDILTFSTRSAPANTNNTASCSQ